MKESAIKYGIYVDIIFSDDLIILHDKNTKFIYNGKELKIPDFAIMRDYNFPISMQLETLGIKLINSSLSMMNSLNKAVTSQLLADKNISTPKFMFTKLNDYDAIHNYFNKNIFVMKKLDGSQGTGVYLIENKNDYNNAFEEINDMYFCQEFIGESYGRDLRVYVLGNDVIGCVKRISVSSFKSNYSLGGRVEMYEADEKIKEISIRAAKATGLIFCGIDLLFTKDSFTVCEVNGNAGFRTISMVSDIDVPMELFRWVNENIY